MQEKHWCLLSDETFIVCVLSAVPPLLGVVHLAVGTMIFSSLLFVGVNDTWTILLRYAVSAVVVQLIRMFEVAGLQYVYNNTAD